MLDFRTYNKSTTNKRYFMTAIGIAVAGAATSSIANAAFGGGSGKSSSTGSTNSQNITPPTISVQNLPTQQNSTAASVYNPTDQMNKWTSIFASMNDAAKSTDIASPQELQTSPNIKVTN